MARKTPTETPTGTKRRPPKTGKASGESPTAKAKKIAPKAGGPKSSSSPPTSPPPTPPVGDARYEAHRERMGENQRAQSARGRDIGAIPADADPARKAACGLSLRRFAETYFPRRFRLAFGAAHLAAIERMERCIRAGGQFALAMPRGAGKTTIAEVAVLWAVLFGHRRFVVLVCATNKQAARRVKQLVREFEANDALLADFPQACVPVRALGRSSHRARGQMHLGRPTRIELTADGLVLADIPGATCAGAVIQVAGMEGAIRGMNVTGPDGEPLRPDFVLLDDCQTRESAKSPPQTADREAVVGDDILGLAGPDTAIAAVMLCTVIYANDLSDRFLSADRHPEWQGMRTKMLEAFPTALELWDRYDEVRRNGLRSRDEGEAANEFYAANRAAMDAGARVSWEGRVKKGDLSPVQTAMNAYYANRRGFFAEMQNEPEPPPATAGAKLHRPADLADRLSGVPQLEVPADCSRLTAFIDVGGEILWYAVVAWTERFGGSVIDYGTYPRQARSVFAATDPRPGLSAVFPGHTEEQRVYAGLNELVPQVLGRPYRRAVGGHDLRIERCLIDAGWKPATVYDFCTASPHAAALYPSKGVGRSDTSGGVGRWKVRTEDGERGGHHWRLTLGERRKGKMVQFDPDAWKTFVFGALTVPLGGGTALTLCGRSAAAHEQFAEHVAAEGSEPKRSRLGDVFDKWNLLPDRADNHWLDCLVGCAVAASVQGLEIPSTLDGPAPRKARKKIDIEELYAAQQGRA